MISHSLLSKNVRLSLSEYAEKTSTVVGLHLQWVYFLNVQLGVFCSTFCEKFVLRKYIKILTYYIKVINIALLLTG